MIRLSRVRPRTPQHCTAVPEAFLYSGLSAGSPRGDCGAEEVHTGALDRTSEIARRRHAAAIPNRATFGVILLDAA
jgi:hypothetical protein